MKKYKKLILALFIITILLAGSGFFLHTKNTNTVKVKAKEAIISIQEKKKNDLRQWDIQLIILM